MRYGLVLAAAAVLYGCDDSPPPPDASSLPDSASSPSSETPEATSSVTTAEMRKLPPELERRCNFADCPSGTKVVTVSSRDGPYYSCQTEALSDYTNFVIGLVGVQARMTGTMPNIDPTTGEPVYKDETEQILTSLRNRAGVETFDSALTHCRYGPYRQKVIVMNYEQSRPSTWVSDDRTANSYWLPTAELEIPRK